MKIRLVSPKVRPLLALVVAVAGLSLLFAACGDDNDNGGGGASAGGDVGQSGEVKCGLGNGKKATGTPIKLGGIATKQPGTDFTDGLNAANAYFKCVNDNGGINGHPIKYYMETEQTDPAQDASLARKLVESDGVIGMTGGFSLIECSINHSYYEQKGFYVLNAGIAPECWSTPNSAPVNTVHAPNSNTASTPWRTPRAFRGSGTSDSASTSDNLTGTDTRKEPGAAITSSSPTSAWSRAATIGKTDSAGTGFLT